MKKQNKEKKNKTKQTKKKRKLFYGRTNLPSTVRWSEHFFFQYLFSFLVAKMIHLKTQKSPKKFDVFLKKNFGKVFRVIVKNFQSNFLRLWPKMANST